MIVDNADVALYVLLAILGIWSVGWLVVGLYKSHTNSKQKYYWLTHAAWVLVNLVIVGFGLLTVSDATLDTEFVTFQRNLVAINALLDIGYIVIAKLLQRHAKESIQQAGKAIFVQGLFLLLLDITFAIIFTLLLL